MDNLIRKKIDEMPLIRSPLKRRYRNNILFSIGFNEKDEIEIGPMVKGKKVKNARSNELVSELGIEVCECVKEFIITKSKVPIVRYPELDGCWRHIHIKENFENQYIINFRLQNFSKYQPEIELELNMLFRFLQQKLEAEILGMYYQNSNKLKEPTIFDELFTIYKKDDLIKCMLGKKFIIHPLTFFQINFKAAELMYIELDKMIKNKISSKPNKKFVLYDMCCGIGVYSILFHQYFDECIGIDYNPNNIKIANEIKSINNINNINFFEGKIEDIMEKYFKEDTREPILIFNPARSGLSDSALNFIKKRKNESFIFILCDPKPIGSLDKIFKHLNYSFKIEMFGESYYFEYILQVTSH